MATGDLALPIAHAALNDPLPPAVRMCPGRPFRQPVDLPDSSQYSAGMELWLYDAALGS